MIRINLLPYRAARKKENIRIQVTIYLGSVIFIGLVIFWVNNMYLKGRIKDLNTEISNIQVQVAKYQKINKEIAEIKQKLQLLDRKIKVIESLELNRKAPVRTLDSLYQLLVEKRMWYTLIEEKAGKIKISGIAIDNQTVADYMTRVEKSERFVNVRLASIKQKKIKEQSLNLKQFDVDFQNQPSESDTVNSKAKTKVNK